MNINIVNIYLWNLVLYLPSLSVNASAFDCKNKVEEYQWEAYIQAIQAASPFTAQGKDVVVMGIILNPGQDCFPTRLMDYSILTSDYEVVWRQAFGDSKYIQSDTRFIDRVNMYETVFKDNSRLLSSLSKDSTGIFTGIFETSNYQDCFITQSDSDWDFLGEYFYALITADGKVHGATSLKLGQATPFDRRYWELMLEILLYTNKQDSKIKHRPRPQSL